MKKPRKKPGEKKSDPKRKNREKKMSDKKKACPIQKKYEPGKIKPSEKKPG